MALLQPDGSVIFRHEGVTYVRSYGANADMTNIKTAKKHRIVVDKRKLKAKQDRALARAQAKLDMRKELAEMRRTR